MFNTDEPHLVVYRYHDLFPVFVFDHNIQLKEIFDKLMIKVATFVTCSLLLWNPSKQKRY